MRVVVLSCSLQRAVGRWCEWCLRKPSPHEGNPLKTQVRYLTIPKKIGEWRVGVEETEVLWVLGSLFPSSHGRVFISVVWSCFLFKNFWNCDSHPWLHSRNIWGTFKTYWCLCPSLDKLIRDSQGSRVHGYLFTKFSKWFWNATGWGPLLQR